MNRHSFNAFQQQIFVDRVNVLLLFSKYQHLQWITCRQNGSDITNAQNQETSRYYGKEKVAAICLNKLFTYRWLLSCQQFSYTHTHTRLTALFPGQPRWAGTRKVKPIWILLKQETVSGSGISWAICKSTPCSKQITTPAPHHSVFYRPDALPAAQPTASKHWRPAIVNNFLIL